MRPTIDSLLCRAEARLAAAGLAEPRREAGLLLASLLDADRATLRARRREPLARTVAARFESWVARRARREPLQYVVGRWEFRGLELRVDPRALIPRPETEGLVDAALRLELPGGASVADLGTGSGCIAVALAVARPDLRVYALDRSLAALELARENAERHGVARRIRFEPGEIARAAARGWGGRMDLVVSNPPYVSEAQWDELEPEVRDHEPRGALVAGPTGLEAYAALAPVAGQLLRPTGRLLLELGFGQEYAVRRLLAAAGLATLAVFPDLQRIPRVLLAGR